MTELTARAQHDFEALQQGKALVGLIDRLLEDFPDPFVAANEHAKRILFKHTGKNIDPRFVWWHQFDTSQTSTRTFTGWQHSGPPVSSISLVELVIRRFDLRFQYAPDELDLYGGFYRQGAHAATFDERNEVAMLGSAVQEDLWALDFAVQYRARVEQFIASYGDDFRVLAKVTLLAHGERASRAGRVDATDLTRLRTLVIAGLAARQMPTLEQLREQSLSTELTIKTCGVLSQGRDCFFTLHANDGRCLLWRPWAVDGLRGFADETALVKWLRQELRDEDMLTAYAEAAVEDLRDQARLNEAKGFLRSLANSRTDEGALAVLQYRQRSIQGSVFAHMADKASQELVSNGQDILDNEDLRKAMLRGYLSAFLNVFAGFAPLGWPVALTILGATFVKVALDVDAAARARDAQARKDALRQAMLESLFGALYLSDLGFQSSFALLAFQAPMHEAHASLGQWRVVESPSLLLADIDVNELLLAERVSEGPLQGIQVRPDGSTWIVMHGLNYRVRYSHDLSVWLIVPPDNPFAFGPLRPVALDDSSEWQLLERPTLVGGSPPEQPSLQSEPSALWDEYIKFDGSRSQTVSARALGRQKRLLKDAPIPMMTPTQVPDLDTHGLDCVFNDGVPEYSYRDANGRYYNALIEYYTDSDSRINDVFRSGTYHYGDEGDYIKDLADTVERLPSNNQVTLFRGGSTRRGTGGLHFRDGRVGVGDVLINTDFTSFTENPYMAPGFAAELISEGERHWRFDDSSVIYELPAGQYRGGTPISAFSMYWDEAETLFLPGHYFRIDALKQIYGEGYRFILVSLSEVPKPISGSVYDLRTGELFNKALFSLRLRVQALADRFFPA